jgi:hypothetical protein
MSSSSGVFLILTRRRAEGARTSFIEYANPRGRDGKLGSLCRKPIQHLRFELDLCNGLYPFTGEKIDLTKFVFSCMQLPCVPRSRSLPHLLLAASWHFQAARLFY